MKKRYVVFALYALQSLLRHDVNAQFNFKPYQTYSTGGPAIPAHVCLGDFNKDGRPDIAAPNWWGANIGVYIFPNNGDGTFAAPDFVSLTGAPHDYEPWYVSVGDLNGDSYPDMVTSNSTFFPPSSISVFLNNGSGNFAPPVFYESGFKPGKVIIKDLNGDNKADIVAANQTDSFISVYINNGDGSFAPQITYFNGYFPSVFAADFNNDGYVDLVVKSQLTNSVNSDISISIMLNDGNGNFAVAPPILTNSPFWGLSEIADLNNDSKPDLIFATGDSPKRFLIFFNNGDATFGSPVSYIIDPQVDAGTIVAIDMNQDNVKDLVINSANSIYNYIYLNDGHGVLGQPITVRKPRDASDLCVADLNGDSRLDFVNGMPFDTFVVVTLQDKETSISIPELKKKNVSIFPNPGRDIAIVLSYVDDRLKVFDLLGRLLIEQKIVKGTNKVDISNLSPSLYTFVIGEQSIKFEKRD